VPLYMAGARMLTNYPTSIVVHGLALNITVQSYDQSLDFGLMADAKAMPDVRELADAIRIAFDDLDAMPRPGEPDHADTPPRETLAGRAQRGLTGAVSSAVNKATRTVVGSAVDGAVSQVTGRLRPRAAKKTPARR
jgi:diacylglycerol O-acyltransferase / wax synthase